MNIHEVIKRPLLTEKVNIMREEDNIVSFAVNPRASKFDIQKAVEELFDVKVRNVRTIRMHRKKRRIGKHIGEKAEWKKAMVKLEEGQTIEFFEGV
jgi:large subunit ribosomal protein L23